MWRDLCRWDVCVCRHDTRVLLHTLWIGRRGMEGGEWGIGDQKEYQTLCDSPLFNCCHGVCPPPPPRLPLLRLLILEAIATATGVINLIICSYSLQHNSPICPACIIHAAGIGLEIRIRTRITSTIDSQRGNYFPGNTTDIFMYICNINIQPLKKKMTVLIQTCYK